MDPLTVAPQSAGMSIVGLGTPFVISGARFCRTLATCSPGTGSALPHTPMCAVPLTSMTKLALPATSGVTGCPCTSTPPGPAFALKPPLNAARRKGVSSVASAGPRSAGRAVRLAGGSEVPTWRSKTTEPASKRASVTGRPDGAENVCCSTATPATSRLTTAHGGTPSGEVVVVVVVAVVVVLVAAAPAAPQPITSARAAATRTVAQARGTRPAYEAPTATRGRDRVG